MRFRPVKESDLDALVALSASAGVGLTTLPHDKPLLEQKIQRACHSFQKNVTSPQDELYLFVLEDEAQNKIVGTSAIEASIGFNLPFYTFKKSRHHVFSAHLNLKNEYETLTISNDLEKTSELCTLFLDRDYRKGTNGLLLSRGRFLFMAMMRHRFHEKIIAEMRGVSDEQGLSPFWEQVIKPFFKMSFEKADKLTVSTDKQFIQDLFPPYPFYVPLMPTEAQEVIGKAHKNSIAALNILLKEGFNLTSHVDIFDAGPVIEAVVENIKTISEIKELTVAIEERPFETNYFLVNPNDHFNVRLEPVTVAKHENVCIMSPLTASKLHLKAGEQVIASPEIRTQALKK
jgi:arginine N-succinyltransferase